MRAQWNEVGVVEIDVDAIVMAVAKKNGGKGRYVLRKAGKSRDKVGIRSWSEKELILSWIH